MPENPECPPCELIEFSQLPKPVLERFLACLNGEGPPPLLISTTGSFANAMGAQVVLAVGGAAALAYLLFAGFWRSVGGSWQALAYPLALFCTIWGILSLVHWFRSTRDVPYEQGLYLFPLDLVETVGPYLRLWPMDSLKGLEITHNHMNSIYTGTTFVFTFPSDTSHTLGVRGKSQAEAVVEALNVGRAFQAGMVLDGLTRRDLDPFADARPSGSWERLRPPRTPQDRHSPRREEKATPPRTPGSLRPGFVGALFLAAIAGGLGLYGASDVMIFKCKSNTTGGTRSTSCSAALSRCTARTSTRRPCPISPTTRSY